MIGPRTGNINGYNTGVYSDTIWNTYTTSSVTYPLDKLYVYSERLNGSVKTSLSTSTGISNSNHLSSASATATGDQLLYIQFYQSNSDLNFNEYFPYPGLNHEELFIQNYISTRQIVQDTEVYETAFFQTNITQAEREAYVEYISNKYNVYKGAYKFDFKGVSALSNNQTLTSSSVGGNTLSAVVEGTGHTTHTFNGFTTPEFTNYDTSIIITIPSSMILSTAGQVIHIYWVLKERDPEHGLHFNFACYNNASKTTRYKTFGNYSLNNGLYLIEPGSITIDSGPYRSNDIIIYDVKLRQGTNACEVTMHAYNGTAWSNNSAVNFDHQYMSTFDRIATSLEPVFGGHGGRMCPCEIHISSTLMTTTDLDALKTKWQGFAQ